MTTNGPWWKPVGRTKLYNQCENVLVVWHRHYWEHYGRQMQPDFVYITGSTDKKY
jgi:hypothetical protein